MYLCIRLSESSFVDTKESQVCLGHHCAAVEQPRLDFGIFLKDQLPPRLISPSSATLQSLPRLGVLITQPDTDDLIVSVAQKGMCFSQSEVYLLQPLLLHVQSDCHLIG